MLKLASATILTTAAKIPRIFGYFILIIPLDKEITITASKLGYETEIKKIILTNKKRYDYVFFMLKDL